MIEAQDMEHMNAILQAMAGIYQTEQNIHQHTAYLGQQCREVFFALDKKYHCSGIGKSLLEVIEEIKIHTDDSNQLAINTVLNTILQSQGKIEPETGIDVANLLIITWDLANHPLAPSNSIGLVMDNLHHNIQADGGCLAGISGRLIQPFCNLLKWILEAKQNMALRSSMWQMDLLNTLQQSSSILDDTVNSDEEIELALALSSSITHGS